MQLRQLEYLDAIARERSFGRAAEACNATQPAVSVAIRKLEAELGIELVRRARREATITPQGVPVLRWAREALASVDGLSAEAARLAGELSGRLRLGVIPTALPTVAAITAPLLDAHPAVDLEVRSLSSDEIAAELASYRIDASLTYLDNEPLGPLAAAPVYDERYVFLSAAKPPGKTIRWAALDGVPLCLLTPDMQNRRIVDATLRRAGATAGARIETDSISALFSYARAGWPSVVSDAWIGLYGVPEGIAALPLVDPEVAHAVGVVTRATELTPPLVRALLDGLPERESAPGVG
ncbi:MAG: LysR family transcriptional regulator [Solirubrobacterales bacterium]